MKIRKGLIKRIHVDRHVIAANRKHGTNQPAVTVQLSGGSRKAHDVHVYGHVHFKYRPAKPLPCGAVCWAETTAEVEIA